MTFAQSLAEALPDPALLLDRQGMVLAANRLAIAVAGLDPTGQHVSHAIRAPNVLGALQQAIKTGQSVRTGLDLRVPVARSFDVTVAPLTGAGDSAALLLLRDLTREQSIERMRSDFVANASHELRTPLAALLGFIETLQGPARNDEKARTRFLNLMRGQAERMTRLINDLLSLSRIETSEHDRPTAVADLGQIARHVIENLGLLARENGVEVVVKIAEPLAVRGSHDELVQVVQNLIENACKYASAGKRVEVEGARTGAVVTLTVRDHGPGIAAEHIPRLTERFYRVNVQDSRARGGTGLGLAIVKHILNRHHGRLSVQSELCQGSAFTVTLPAAMADPER